MKKFVNRSLSAFLKRYFNKVDTNQVSSLISNGQYEEKNISLNQSFFQNFKIPFTIYSSNIDSIKIDTLSSTSNFLIEGINSIAMYSDCSEFNPYLINPPSLSFFSNKLYSENTVKKILFSFLFKIQKINLIMKTGALHFEIPRCKKIAENDTNINNFSFFGSFGLIFDEISLSNSNEIKISNLSIYVFPQLDHLNIEKFESFKENLVNNQTNSFILKNFNYEGQINDIQINKEILLDFNYFQISFLRLFGRKIYYSNCGCPNVYTKDTCLSWWSYTHRCFLKDKHCFNIQSAITFLKNRRSFNSNFERDQFLMFNAYKKSSYRQNNSEQSDLNLVDFTNDEKEGFVDFYDKSSPSLSSSSIFSDVDFKISFLEKLRIKIRNTVNGTIDLGKITIQKENGSTTIHTDQINISYDFLSFLFQLIKRKLIFKNENGKELKITIPLLKIDNGNNGSSTKDPIGSIDIHNISYTEKGFSIDSIQNYNQKLNLSTINAEEDSESSSMKKKYIIKIDTMNLTTKILFNLLFYKNKMGNYYNNNSSPNLNLHQFFYFFQDIEYVLGIENCSLFINNNLNDYFSFKMHFVNTFESLVIGIDKISFGQILKDFYFTATINYSNEGRSIFFDLDRIKMSLFPSEIPILLNLLTELKPLIFKYLKMIPQIECLIFCSKGFSLTLEMPEYSLVQLNISECTLKSLRGLTQFSIENNHALFYDKKLSKWCMLIQPFNITSSIQATKIDLFLSLQFNFTRVFFNDINKFFSCKDERVDIPRKVRIKNLTSYQLLVEEKKEINQTDNKNESENDDDENENKNNENNNNDNNDDGQMTKIDVNETIFMNSRKFRVEIENPQKKSNESYVIDSNHLQFPLYISNEIVLSKGENSICFCSPFVFVNKTSFKNICIYEMKKDKNSNNDDEVKISLVGCLKSKGSKIGLYHPNVFITGETDIGNQIFANYIHDEEKDGENHEYKMLPIISQTIDKKPHLINIIYNGDKETILVSSEFNYEKGALFVYLMNPFVIVNHVPECKSVSLSLSTTIINPKEKRKWGRKKTEDESEDPKINCEINNLQPYEKSSIPLNLIPSCLSFFQTQQQQHQQKGKIKNKIVNNSFDIVVKLNHFLGIPNNVIESQKSHIVVSDDYQFYPIHFSEKQFTFSLALKIQFNPRKGNWSFILFAPSIIENRTNLDISINSVGKINITNFFLKQQQNDNNEINNRIIFGCDSFFTESRSMPVFVGYNREFKLSTKPIELCFTPFSAPLLLPSLIHKNCFLPLFYKTSSEIENKKEDENKKEKHFNELFTVIDFYKIIENCTDFDFTLTPIDEITNQDTYTHFNTNNESSEKSKKNKKVEIDENSDDESKYPEILFKKNEKKPILLSTSSFCFKFKYKETVLPICLFKDNFRTCFRVDKTEFVLLTITEKVARFEISDFSPQKVFMTFTNMIPKEAIFINSSASQPPIIIEPNTTSLFGFDSPFESTSVSIFGLNDQIEFKVDRCYEPLSSSMNKFIVQTISKPYRSNSGEIVHSVVVRSVEMDDRESGGLSNAQIIDSPNGENLNANSNLKGVTRISIEQESESDSRNFADESEAAKSESDSVVQSRLIGQYSDQIGLSYDTDDVDCFAGYELNVSVPIFEISLIDDRLSELALVCLYQSSLKISNERLVQTKSIQFSIKSLQFFDMNVMTLFPTVISSNPDNGSFLAVEINYFDKITVDQLKVTISPILISPDINFLNELYYFFRKINSASSIVNRVNSNSLMCNSKLFNLIQIDPIVIVINIKTQSSRKLNTPKLVTFNKNLTTSFALNGFIIHNADTCPSFFLAMVKYLAQMKLNYTKIFYLQNPNEIPITTKTIQKQKVPQNKMQTFLSTDPVEERISEETVYSHFFSFPAFSIDPLIEKNLKDKPAKILDALSQTESYFKLASDKMRLISNDKIDRDEYLIPPRKRRSQTVNSQSSSSISPSTGGELTLNNNNSESKIQGSVKKEKAANAAQTVANGFSSAAKSLSSGFTGIIRKPIEGGKENGAKGAFKGIGQGILGVLTCTVSSVIEVGSGIAGGIRKSIIKDNTSNYEQCRPPSTFLLRCITTNSANSNVDKNENRIKEDVKNNFDDDVIENAELAQQAINSGNLIAVAGGKEENLLFFSNVEQNQKRIAFIGITADSIFLFNSALSVLNKFDLESITWFKKKSESLSNNDIDFNLDVSMRRKIVFDQYNSVNKKSTRYELELPSENNADLAVQFFSSKLRVLDIIRDEQGYHD